MSSRGSDVEDDQSVGSPETDDRRRPPEPHEFNALASEPLYPLGFGLSDTTFRYDTLRVSAEQLPAD